MLDHGFEDGHLVLSECVEISFDFGLVGDSHLLPVVLEHDHLLEIEFLSADVDDGANRASDYVKDMR
jgi:hypothetical protein